LLAGVFPVEFRLLSGCSDAYFEVNWIVEENIPVGCLLLESLESKGRIRAPSAAKINQVKI